MKRLRVGIIGCGLIAQVMHLNYLRELADRFEIAALCDISQSVRDACARDYNVAKTFGDWRDLLKERLDAVLILTPGSHAPIAIAAAEAGIHVLVEKPMCFSVAEGQEMIAAAAHAGVVLMVAYNKQYDPAFVRLKEEAKSLQDLRLIRVTTLESPLKPYVDHYALHRGGGVPADLLAKLGDDTDQRITQAIATKDALARKAYHLVLLDSMVHEFNVVRGVLGEPDELTFADISETGLTAILRYGKAQCTINWVDLPGIARYQMEFAFYTPTRRLTLSMPSPFLRNAPTLLIDEGGDAASAKSYRNEEIISYNESFKEELLHFHDCVTKGLSPRTSGPDSLRDIALCQSIIKAHLTRKPVARPTDMAAPRA
ncbi:Gfo/Idh/MocA family oxidoreductase [Nordella sp. HKS 07]|uniref:Gfo/Idh/MocA family protein n=1 Tax=Nordella sp. HKS 07 TaxID=2712222 RepID=UPI0013E1D26A|nr:Gfo/Idh/MocA family oxidoreductase [Nordella sp. HKS 07]QIG47738.1 Gfo/Idh/MocA family oxidoreductase [Nordella sp. HKS 07]